MSSDLPPGPGQPEYLGSGAPTDAGAGPGSTEPGTGRPRRTALLAGVVLGVAGALAVGGWGVAQLMSGGSSPATAVPAIAVAYVSIDLDPSAAQKIEALRMLKKFPAIDDRLGLDVRDDLRRLAFEEFQTESGCDAVDYARDIEPWLGNRLAVAAVPDAEGGAAPLVAIEVGDQQAARAAVQALESCGDRPNPAGVAFVGDYLLLSESQEDADALATAAEAAPLADDPQFTDWMARVGDPGVVSLYASADAPRIVLDQIGDEKHVLGDLPGGLRDLSRDFEGMAAVVRFDDGALETEFAARGLDSTGAVATQATAPSLADLPASTALAFGFAVPDNWVQEFLKSAGGPTASGDELLAEAEAQTGLELPEDLETLLGDGLSVAVDGDVDFEALVASPDPGAVPAAVRIDGDARGIRRVIDRLLDLAGSDADQVVVEETETGVVVGLDRDYVTALAGGSPAEALGDVESFQRVVPDPDRISGAFYLNFDAGSGWSERLADALTEGADGVTANVAPLDAVGVVSWLDDDQVQHGLFTLTTD